MMRKSNPAIFSHFRTISNKKTYPFGNGQKRQFCGFPRNDFLTSSQQTLTVPNPRSSKVEKDRENKKRNFKLRPSTGPMTRIRNQWGRRERKGTRQGRNTQSPNGGRTPKDIRSEE